MSTSTQILVLLGAALFTSPAFAAPPQAAPADSAQYVSAIDNPWFPLKPGTILIYNGTKDKKRADREFEVTAKTKLIAGVTCRIVEAGSIRLGDAVEILVAPVEHVIRLPG